MIKDVSDYFQAGYTLDDFLKLAQSAPDFAPPPKASVKVASINGAPPSSTGNPPTTAPPSRPSIYARNRSLPDITRETRDAIIASNDPPHTFNYLNRIAVVKLNNEGRSVIHIADKYLVTGIAADAARYWYTTDAGDRDCSPPMGMVCNLMTWALDSHRLRFPVLAGVAQTPLFRPDFSIVTETGYDPVTRYWVDYQLPRLNIPFLPTKEELRAAVALLRNLFVDFPFANASFASAIATMLTTVLRVAIDGFVPMNLVTAPWARTGKGKLIGVMMIVLSGRAPAQFTLPKDEEELRKKITTFLAEGAAVMVIDNISRTLESDVLCALLTEQTHKDRLLGSNTGVEIPMRSVLIASGNNIQVRGDLRFRCYWTRLDAKTSEPWKRNNFQHPNIEQWAREHRTELLSALLTLPRAWVAAGKPNAENVPVLGGFEEWSRIIGGILHFAGIEDFLANLDEYRSDDEEIEWRLFLYELHRVFENREFTTAETAGQVGLDEGLREALPGGLREKAGDPGFTRRLGLALGKRVDTRFGEEHIYLKKVKVSHKVGCWQIMIDHPQAATAGTPLSTPLQFEIGDWVQHESMGTYCFHTPQPITGFSPDRQYAVFKHTKTGIPVKDLRHMMRPAFPEDEELIH
jgi:putative DNA primase/helicase